MSDAPAPLCTLTVTLTDGAFSFDYVAAPGATVTLGQWALALSKLTSGAIENASVTIPDLETRAANAAAAKAAEEG